MKLQTKITIELVSEAIGHFLHNVTEQIVPVGQMIAQLVDQDGYGVYAKLQKDHPRLSLNTIVTIEKVGRGQLLPELAFDGSPAARKLASMPFEAQKKIYSEPVKLFRLWHGKTEAYEKPLQQITDAAELKQVFADDRPRTVEERQAFAVNAVQPYQVKTQKAKRFTINPDGSIDVLDHSHFELSDWESILADAKLMAMKQLTTKK